jgi:hypothetical protein
LERRMQRDDELLRRRRESKFHYLRERLGFLVFGCE